MSELALQLIKREAERQTGSLDLGNCGLTSDNPQLEEVWEELRKLGELEELNFSSTWEEWDIGQKDWDYRRSGNSGAKNYLTQIPSIFNQVSKLKKLILGGEYNNNWGITQIEEIAVLSSLEHLDLSYNSISKSEAFKQLEALEFLDLSHNSIGKLEGFKRLGALKSLNLSFNSISELADFDQLSALQSLDLSYNSISKIEGLDGLIELKSLNLSNNLIREIIGLKQLTALESLDFSNNLIREIKGLKQLKALASFNLSNNLVPKLKGLKRLTALEFLFLSENPIKKLEGINQLPILKWLEISNTKINDLYPLKEWIIAGVSVKDDFLAEGICIKGCPISNPPINIVRRGNGAILQYFAEAKEVEEDPIIEPCKIYISYSYADIDYLKELEKRLKPFVRDKRIKEISYDTKLEPGKNRELTVQKKIAQSNLILLLNSADFWSSDFIFEKEVKFADAREQKKECTMILILARSENYWPESALSDLQAIPTNPITGKLSPISSWEDKDQAWKVVIEAILEKISP